MWFDEKCWRSAAGFNGFLAVVMSAVAAHAVVDVHAAALAKEASLYQLIHAVVLLWLADQQGKGFGIVRWLFLGGIVLFCGTLYLKALTGWADATTLAPLGGVSFMTGWLLIIWANRKSE